MAIDWNAEGYWVASDLDPEDEAPNGEPTAHVGDVVIAPGEWALDDGSADEGYVPSSEWDGDVAPTDAMEFEDVEQAGDGDCVTDDPTDSQGEVTPDEDEE